MRVYLDYQIWDYIDKNDCIRSYFQLKKEEGWEYFISVAHLEEIYRARKNIPMLLHIIGAVMAFTTLNAFSGKINFKTNRLYLFFEKNNFTIYLFHQQIIYLVITLLNGKVPSGVLAICNFAIAIILSSLIAVVLNKWKLTRFLTGQKA